MENLYDYLFHYNPYKKAWFAFRREDKEAYFNGELPESKLLKSKDIKTLVGYISKDKK